MLESSFLGVQRLCELLLLLDWSFPLPSHLLGGYLLRTQKFILEHHRALPLQLNPFKAHQPLLLDVPSDISVLIGPGACVASIP